MKCNSTNIINELYMPVLGVGLTNVIIAVSCEEIFVVNKEQVDCIKDYVNNFKNINKNKLNIKVTDADWRYVIC